MVKKIEHTAYLQLLGLKVLARQINARRDEMERAAAELVGAPDEGGGYYGHASDFIMDDNTDADSMLRKLKIEVKPPQRSKR